MTGLHFPITTKEDVLKPGSTMYLDYMATYSKVFSVLKTTGSKGVFLFLLNTICREDFNITNEFAVETLMKTPNKLELLKEGFGLIAPKDQPNSIPSIMKWRITSLFLATILKSSSRSVLIDFFTENMNTLIEYSLKAIQGNEKEMKDAIFKRLISLRLFSSLYFGLTLDFVHTNGSSITQAAFKSLSVLRPNDFMQGGFTGKELSKYLIAELKNLRGFSLEGSTDFQDLILQLHQEAYNCMISILATIQTEEKFFNGFLFQEDLKNDKPIWGKIIDLTTDFNFQLTTNDVPKKKKAIVAIRRLNHHEAPEDKMSSVHFLNDSSLSQDVGSYDFHDSLLIQDRPPIDTSKADQVDVPSSEVNIVTMEGDALNGHGKHVASNIFIDFCKSIFFRRVHGIVG